MVACNGYCMSNRMQKHIELLSVISQCAEWENIGQTCSLHIHILNIPTSIQLLVYSIVIYKTEFCCSPYDHIHSRTYFLATYNSVFPYFFAQTKGKYLLLLQHTSLVSHIPWVPCWPPLQCFTGNCIFMYQSFFSSLPPTNCQHIPL